MLFYVNACELQFGLLTVFPTPSQDLKERTDKEQHRDQKVDPACLNDILRRTVPLLLIRIKLSFEELVIPFTKFKRVEPSPKSNPRIFLTLNSFLCHQRIKVVSDLLVQLATVERQEARSRLQQECNRLGNVGVMRCEFPHLKI